MGKQRAYVTGHKARAAIQESITLLDEIQRDMVAFAIAGAMSNPERLEEIGRGMIGKMQRIENLLRAALSGRFEGVGEVKPDVQEEEPEEPEQEEAAAVARR